MGIHHITAIADDPQRNLDFYAGVLGMRLIKLTVNFDDPTTYHLYYGDEAGRPGSIVTFFPWPRGQRGRQGTVNFTAQRSGKTGIWALRNSWSEHWASCRPEKMPASIDSSLAIAPLPRRFTSGGRQGSGEEREGLGRSIISRSGLRPAKRNWKSVPRSRRRDFCCLP
jgi:Glyoxalase/Bleomycin resistance protein/Dioxygenase superfamily